MQKTELKEGTCYLLAFKDLPEYPFVALWRGSDFWRPDSETFQFTTNAEEAFFMPNYEQVIVISEYPKEA